MVVFVLPYEVYTLRISLITLTLTFFKYNCFFYFNLIFWYKLVILWHFFFIYVQIKLTYVLTYLPLIFNELLSISKWNYWGRSRNWILWKFRLHFLAGLSRINDFGCLLLLVTTVINIKICSIIMSNWAVGFILL